MVDCFMLDKVLCNIKNIIGIEKFNDTKILTRHAWSTALTRPDILPFAG